MSTVATNSWEPLAPPAQVAQLKQARRRGWGGSLVLVGWLHLVAFALCSYLSVGLDYHDSAGYLAIWAGEVCGMMLIFRLRGGPRTANPPPLANFVMRVWIAYFVLAFNLGTLNTLRGHRLFELFPAIASLASFAFLVMTFAVSRRFAPAVLVMFASGLLMASNLPYQYLTFAVAWWLVLNAIGLTLLTGTDTTSSEIAENESTAGRLESAAKRG